MSDITKIINEGKIKDIKTIEQFTKQINNIKVAIDDIFKKKEEEKISENILFNMELKYKYYKLFKYEKIFILYNEFFVDIN